MQKAGVAMTAPTDPLACVVARLAELDRLRRLFDRMQTLDFEIDGGVFLGTDECYAVLGVADEFLAVKQQLRAAAAMRDALAAKLADLDGREIHHFSGSVRYELPDSWFDDLRNALQKGAGDGK
jgi:hypothetical protein